MNHIPFTNVVDELLKSWAFGVAATGFVLEEFVELNADADVGKLLFGVLNKLVVPNLYANCCSLKP